MVLMRFLKSGTNILVNVGITVNVKCNEAFERVPCKSVL